VLLTIGYGGYTQTAFIDALVAAGVETLADVRQSPRSRKPGFSGGPLARRLAERGIRYLHLPELGAPPALRQALAGGLDFASFLAAYREHASAQTEALERLAALARDGVVAATCLETDPALCHRGVLATIVRERWPEIEVVVT
jgi:uncharacterized protein (DUF488 family)